MLTRLENITEEGTIVREHIKATWFPVIFSQNICFINIEWKRFRLLRKHYCKTCKYNDPILDAVYEIPCMGKQANRCFTLVFFSYVSVIGNKNINLHGYCLFLTWKSSWIASSSSLWDGSGLISNVTVSIWNISATESNYKGLMEYISVSSAIGKGRMIR